MFAASSLENQFLIAMPSMDESYFSESVSIMCQHTEEGAIGLVVNKPMPTSMAEVFIQMNLPTDALPDPDQLIGSGGPVQPEVGFVLHSPKGDWEATLRVSNDLHLTSSRDILEAISRGEGPKEFQFYLGYAGWAAGQIEHELEQNSWLHTPVDTKLLFSTRPEVMWQSVKSQLGFDPASISSQIGHA